jgi:hypothetical protein
MLLMWQEGVQGLREKRVDASGEWSEDKAFEGISDPSKLANPSTAIGGSPLLGDRSKSPKSKSTIDTKEYPLASVQSEVLS